MSTCVAVFNPYPFVVGEKINISQGPRHGDWMVAAVDDKKVTLRCPLSGKEFAWDRFCYLVETREQVWPQIEGMEKK
jgi:hypothetical protein